MAPPVALPEGIVVDFDSSGMGNVIYDKFGAIIPEGTSNQHNVVRDMFCANGERDQKSVTIMFSPTGEVEKVYFSNPAKNSINLVSDIPRGPIFLNIGNWDCAGFWMEDKDQSDPLKQWYISSDNLPDSRHAIPNDPSSPIIGTRNYHDMNNYWVTIFPRTGAVRVNRVAESNILDHGAIKASRNLANSLHSAETR
jgi:hypothetical protein